MDSIFPLSYFPFQVKNFHHSRNEKIIGQKVPIPKIIFDISFFIKYGISEVFDAQGWLKLFTDEKPIFSWLVKEFYANLFFSQNSRILKSFVHGKEITLDDSTLGRILNIPCEE